MVGGRRVPLLTSGRRGAGRPGAAAPCRSARDRAGHPIPASADGIAAVTQFGAGAGYDFNPHFSVGHNYDYFRAKRETVNPSSGLTTVSAEYRF